MNTLLTKLAVYERKLAELKLLDAFVEFILGIGPERGRDTPR
jgi:hypothetical protein